MIAAATASLNLLLFGLHIHPFQLSPLRLKLT